MVENFTRFTGEEGTWGDVEEEQKLPKMVATFVKGQSQKNPSKRHPKKKKKTTIKLEGKGRQKLKAPPTLIPTPRAESPERERELEAFFSPKKKREINSPLCCDWPQIHFFLQSLLLLLLLCNLYLSSETNRVWIFSVLGRIDLILSSIFHFFLNWLTGPYDLGLWLYRSRGEGALLIRYLRFVTGNLPNWRVKDWVSGLVSTRQFVARDPFAACIWSCLYIAGTRYHWLVLPLPLLSSLPCWFCLLLMLCKINLCCCLCGYCSLSFHFCSIFWFVIYMPLQMLRYQVEYMLIE